MAGSIFSVEQCWYESFVIR